MRSVVALLLVIAVSVAGASCRQAEKPSAGEVAMAGEVVTISRLRSIPSGICDAAEIVGRNVDSARATFFGQSHDGLHLIARALEDVDRTAAATLLEAKQKVEADFLSPPPAAQLTADLRRLADVTRTSLARFNVNADACPPA